MCESGFIEIPSKNKCYSFILLIFLFLYISIVEIEEYYTRTLEDNYKNIFLLYK